MLACASGLHSRLLLLALVGAAPGLALLLHAVALHRRGLERDVRDHVANVASLTSEALRERFESARGLLTALAEDLPVQDLDGPACSRLFASILVKFPAYANIGAIAPDGRLFCSALPTPPVDLSTREYFRRAVASRGIVLGEYAIGLVAKRPVLHVAYPSIDGSGTLRAVVYVALDLGAFTQAIPCRRGSSRLSGAGRAPSSREAPIRSGRRGRPSLDRSPRRCDPACAG